MSLEAPTGFGIALTIDHENQIQASSTNETQMTVLQTSHTNVLLVIQRSAGGNRRDAIYAIVGLYLSVPSSSAPQHRGVGLRDEAAAGGDKPATLELMSGSNEMELLRNVVIYVFQLYWSGKGRNDLDQLVSAVNLVSKMYASGGSAELLAEYADHGYLLSGHGNTGL